MYEAPVSRLANTSSADYMQPGTNAKLSDGDSVSSLSGSPGVNVRLTAARAS